MTSAPQDYKTRPRILMPTARRRVGDGQFKTVTASRFLSDAFVTALRQSTKDHDLLCPHCEAGVTFVKSAARAIAGTNENQASPHFRLAAGETHEENCPIKRFGSEGSSPHEYDRTIGWRIHLNTREFSTEYATRDAVYQRDANHHLKPNANRLPQGETAEKFMSRETVAVKNVKDILKLIERGNMERLNDSLVVYEDKVIPWKSFFIRGKRYLGLAEKLSAGASHLPVLMHFETERAVVQGRWGKSVFASAKPIFWKRDGRNQEMFVQPRAWIDNRDDGFLCDAFQKVDGYFVLGLARTTQPAPGIRAINVSLTSFEQVEKGSLEHLVAKVKAKAGALPQNPANE